MVHRPGDGFRTLKKVTVAGHKVAGHKVVRLALRGQIEVRFVLWVASQSYVGSDIVNVDADSFDSRDELGDSVIRQLSELGCIEGRPITSWISARIAGLT